MKGCWDDEMSGSVDGRMTVWVARLLWLAPVLLVVITVSLIWAGFSLKNTLESGVVATARVVDVKIRNRADVTYGHIDLRVPNTSGDSTDARLPLPLSLLMSLEGAPTVEVRLLDHTDQPIVIDRIARAQWRMSFINASMTLLGALLLVWGVWSWNRYLDEGRKQRADSRS